MHDCNTSLLPCPPPPLTPPPKPHHAALQKRYGSLPLCRWGMAGTIALCSLMPTPSLLAGAGRHGAAIALLCLLMLVKSVVGNCAFTGVLLQVWAGCGVGGGLGVNAASHTDVLLQARAGGRRELCSKEGGGACVAACSFAGRSARFSERSARFV